MNKEISKSLDLLIEEIKKTSEYKLYIEAKRNVEDSEFLNKILAEMDYLKKCSIDTEERKRYYVLKKEYDENPLMIELEKTREDLYLLLKEIKDILEL